jgi:hypothetical protein
VYSNQPKKSRDSVVKNEQYQWLSSKELDKTPLFCWHIYTTNDN